MNCNTSAPRYNEVVDECRIIRNMYPATIFLSTDLGFIENDGMRPDKLVHKRNAEVALFKLISLSYTRFTLPSSRFDRIGYVIHALKDLYSRK